MIVLVGGEKGGTGKTTLATNLAVLRTSQNHNTLLIDADPQGSSLFWSDCRVEHTLAKVTVMTKTGETLSQDLKPLSERYDDIIIDTGGRDAKELRSAMILAHKIIVPIQPSAFDLWTLSAVNKLLKTAKAFNPAVESKILLSRVTTNQFVSDEAETREALKEFPDLELFETVIHDRIAFRKAAKQGKAVVELDPTDEKANNEINRIYLEVFG